ncbi:hypothetical protein FQR65_LT07640 [Abscondita terminalis]|nr:hypothetical protein FQR65_LT07640 [Abscondita terminalis]
MKRLLYSIFLFAVLFAVGANSTQDCLGNISLEAVTSDPDEMNKVYLCIWRNEGALNEEGVINKDVLKRIAKQQVSDVSKDLEIISQVSDYIVETCSKLDKTQKHFGINLHICIEECISAKLEKNDEDVV